MVKKNKSFGVKTGALPIFIKILGFLMIFNGFFLISNGNYRGLASLLSGFVFAFSYLGFDLDFENKRFKEYFLLVIFKLGSWQSISKFDYVLVRKVAVRWDLIPRNYVLYKVFLKDKEQRRRIELCTTKNKEEAIELGRYVSENLEFEIRIDVERAY